MLSQPTFGTCEHTPPSKSNLWLRLGHMMPPWIQTVHAIPFWTSPQPLQNHKTMKIRYATLSILSANPNHSGSFHCTPHHINLQVGPTIAFLSLQLRILCKASISANQCYVQGDGHSDKPGVPQDTMNTFSRQLKRLLPLVIALANVHDLLWCLYRAYRTRFSILVHCFQFVVL